MVTLKDVARKAGVSMSTASAALRGKDIVKPDTTQRVLEAANTLNYRINLSARALRSGKSDIFTMIVPDLGKSVLREDGERHVQRAHGG